MVAAGGQTESLLDRQEAATDRPSARRGGTLPWRCLLPVGSLRQHLVKRQMALAIDRTQHRAEGIIPSWPVALNQPNSLTADRKRPSDRGQLLLRRCCYCRLERPSGGATHIEPYRCPWRQPPG
jgi:hypothetical protein